jgi:thiamine kinase-like enzyme
MTRPVPIYPKDITAGFLSELVGELRPGVTIDSVDIVKVKNYGDADNATSVSTSVQVSLDVRYGRGAPRHLPTRLLTKIAIPNDVDCSNPELDALFKNEIAFYGRLRQELDIESPLGLGGRFDDATKRFILLMEDLTPRAPHINSMMDDDDVAVVEALLDTLAKLHAHFWETPRFNTDLSWVQNQEQGTIEDLFDGSVREHIIKELAREKFKREFVQEVGTTEAEMYAEEEAMKRHFATLPQTFVHGDAHFGNTYVLPDGKGGLLDWQVSTRGYSMFDVGYLIPTALSVELRRNKERELLAFYRDRLCSYGVKNAPDMETLWLEYRRAQIHGFYLGWLTAPRENYGWEAMVVGNHRTKVAYQDHETRKLLAGMI